MNIILGAGLAGLSASYHLGHDKCLILEKKAHAFGHIHSISQNGFTWDEGPHVSFTKHAYVQDLFARSVNGAYREFEAKVANYYQGVWLDHPAQSNFYQIPQDLRQQCLTDFLRTRETLPKDFKPADYGDWLRAAFGSTFANVFPAAYTRKYWTVEPSALGTDWIGNRVYLPSVDDVVSGAKGPPNKSTHYVQKMRYPEKGGYQAFGRLIAEGAQIRHDCAVTAVDLLTRQVRTASGELFNYERLISSIPLPTFVKMCTQATSEVLQAANILACSQMLLVSVEVPHPALRDEHWLYVYDEDKFTTRLHFMDNLAPANVPSGKGGIQVEVYASRFKPFALPADVIAERVVDELYEMKLIDPAVARQDLRVGHNLVDWANVIFTNETRAALEVIYNWLSGYGLARRGDRDLDPITDWNAQQRGANGQLSLIGRFGAWKYYWTDDCVLEGYYL